MRNLNLNKREKILIYVLSIVLLLFIYMNFIRDAKVTKINSLKLNESTAQECENLIKLNSTFESDIKNLSKVNDRISTQYLNFGNRVDLAEKIVEHNLELISYSISKPQRESYEGMDYSYIESVSILEGTLGYFINLKGGANEKTNFVDCTSVINASTKCRIRIKSRCEVMD